MLPSMKILNTFLSKNGRMNKSRTCWTWVLISFVHTTYHRIELHSSKSCLVLCPTCHLTGSSVIKLKTLFITATLQINPTWNFTLLAVTKGIWSLLVTMVDGCHERITIMALTQLINNICRYYTMYRNTSINTAAT